jgi:hypothetical protein
MTAPSALDFAFVLFPFCSHYERDGTKAVGDMTPWHRAVISAGEHAGPLAAATEVGLAERFHAWRGRSGRRYVVSVYPAESAPDYRDAVVLHVVRCGSLRRLASLGIAPRGAVPSEIDEIHVHLLARDDGERAAVIADLGSVIDVARVTVRS